MAVNRWEARLLRKRRARPHMAVLVVALSGAGAIVHAAAQVISDPLRIVCVATAGENCAGTLAVSDGGNAWGLTSVSYGGTASGLVAVAPWGTANNNSPNFARSA